MSTALKNALGAASPSRGTLLVDWVSGWPYTLTASFTKGIINVQNSAFYPIIYHSGNNRYLSVIDGTNTSIGPNIDFAIGQIFTLAARWDSTANGGVGYLQESTKVSGSWSNGTLVAYDGILGTAIGVSLRLAYGNEYPFWIKNIRIYDGWVKDANLDRPALWLEDGNDELKVIKRYEY
jgi:hypothetical protein